MASILATGRIDIPITVAGSATHHTRMYCNWVATPGVGSGFALESQPSGQVDFHTAMAHAIPLIAACYDNGAQVGPATLESYSANTWTPLAVDTVSGAGTGGGVPVGSLQCSLEFRVTGLPNTRFRVQLMEPSSNQTPANVKFTVPASCYGNWAPLVADMLTKTSPDIGFWLEGRTASAQFGFISMLTVYNKKLRRRHGLA